MSCLSRGLILALLCSPAVLPPSAAAAGLEKLTPARIAADPPLLGTLPTDLRWHPDGKRLTYLRKREGGSDLLTLDAATGRESVLLAASAVTIPGGASPSPLPMAGYAWSPSGDQLLVAYKGDLYVVEARSGSVRALTRTSESLPRVP